MGVAGPDWKFFKSLFYVRCGEQVGEQEEAMVTSSRLWGQARGEAAGEKGERRGRQSGQIGERCRRRDPVCVLLIL